MILALFFAVAGAQAPSCEPLTEADLADRIHGSLDAIQRADVEGHRAIIRDLETRLGCLDFVPSPERWAELLVGIAIVEYASGGDWQAPLTTALRVHPTVDLLVGPTHTFRSWSPAGVDDVLGREVPAGVRIYVDGEIVTQVRDEGGIHLVQRRTGDGWSTLLLRDEPIPQAWLEEPILASGGVRADVRVGLTGGLGRSGQVVDPEGTWLVDRSAARGVVGIGLGGLVGLAKLPGIYADLRMPELPRSRFALAQGGVDVPLGPAWVRAGAGVAWHEAVDGDGAVGAVVAVPLVGVGAASEVVDAAAQLAWVPGFTRVGAAGGVTVTQATLRPRFGLDLAFTQAEWEQPGEQRQVHVTELGLAAVAGVVWRVSP